MLPLVMWFSESAPTSYLQSHGSQSRLPHAACCLQLPPRSRGSQRQPALAAPSHALSHVVLRVSSHTLPAVPSHAPVTWFLESSRTRCPQSRPESRDSQSLLTHLHTEDTYILVAFPFLQMAVRETPPTLPIGDELAEKTYRTRLTSR